MKTEWVYGMAKFNVSVDTLGSGRYRGGGQRGPCPPPRSPRPNFAVAKVCRIQGWKNTLLKIPSF